METMDITTLLGLVGVLKILVVIFLLSFMVETLVEAVFGRLFDQIPVIRPYKWATFYLAVAAGILGAMVYSFDLLYILSGFLEIEYIKVTTYGIVLTGISIGMGASYIHQIITKFFPTTQAAG